MQLRKAYATLAGMENMAHYLLFTDCFVFIAQNLVGYFVVVVIIKGQTGHSQLM